MTKLKVHTADTPSEAVVKAANATVTVKDSNGRAIEVRKLKTLDRMRLLELVGAENAMNDRDLGYATLAYCVVSIDGEPMPRLVNKVGLEGIVQRLDEEGIEAVSRAVAENFIKAD